MSPVMFRRFVSRNFWFGGVSKPMFVMMAVSTDLTDSQDKTESSTFQVAVWTLGTQLETKRSFDFLKSKCPLIF